jgi:DNA-binding transcriptional ArsR family regulator
MQDPIANAKGDPFIQVNCLELMQVAKLVGKRKIQHRDFVVLMLFISFINWRSRRSRLTADKAAEILNVKRISVTTAIKRLKEAGLMVRTKDKSTGELYYLLSPYLIGTGGGSSHGVAIKAFMDVLAEETGLTELPSHDDEDDM